MFLSVVYVCGMVASISVQSSQFGALSRSSQYRNRLKVPMSILPKLTTPVSKSRECATITCALATRKNAHWGLRKLNDPSFSYNPPKDYTNYVYPEEAGDGVVVYILDTGFSDGFDSYKNKIRKVDMTGTSTYDFKNHGTMVASIIGGINNGVAKNVEIVSVKVLGGESGADEIIRGLEFVKEDVKKHGKKAVINMSLGFVRSYFNHDKLRYAVKQVTDLGVIIIKAAGNENEPAGSFDILNKMKNVIVVGAIDEDNNASGFSNHGKLVDIYAPGGNVGMKHNILGIGLKYNFGIYGTSFAAPYVAGVAAIYFSAGVENVYQELLDNAHEGEINPKTLHGSQNRIVNNIPKNYI